MKEGDKDITVGAKFNSYYRGQRKLKSPIGLLNNKENNTRSQPVETSAHSDVRSAQAAIVLKCCHGSISTSVFKDLISQGIYCSRCYFGVDFTPDALPGKNPPIYPDLGPALGAY